MGTRRQRAKQTSMWVAAQDLPRSAAHPFYERLNHILDNAAFDRYVEGLCQQFYADEIGRPGLPPGRYFRLLLIGYFEGLDAERAIAWRAADSFALREFLGLVLPEAPPDHSTISRTRRLIDLEMHEAVFTWMLQRLADVGFFTTMVWTPPGSDATSLPHPLIPVSSNQEAEMDATTVAVDLAKTVFELAIANAQWRVVGRQRLNRSQFRRLLTETAPHTS
jgi:transposase